MTEGADGEPRAGMLETIREYALERLAEAGEEEQARRRHAEYYAAFAEQATQQLNGREHLAWLDRLEAEHDNLRAALSWSLEAGAADGERAATGLRLVQALGQFWFRHGHVPEGRRWLERAIDLAPDDAGAPLGRLAHWLGVLLDEQGELEAGLKFLERSLAIWRELGDRDQQARELNSLGITHRWLGHLDTARSMLEESAAIAREIGSDYRLAGALTNLGQAESEAGNLDRAAQVLQEALALDRKQGDTWGVVLDQQSLAVVSLRAGRIAEANELVSATFDYVATSGDTGTLVAAIEQSACIAAELGDGMRAARLAGAAEAIRDQAGTPITQSDAAFLERFLAPARATIDRAAWDAALAAGRALTQEQAITLLTSPTLSVLAITHGRSPPCPHLSASAWPATARLSPWVTVKFEGWTMPRPVAHLANLDLNLLVALRELVRERSVTRAAERLGVTQPAASAALSRLRRHFGDELLIRDRGEYTLTALGAQLAEQVDAVCAAAERLFAASADFDPAVSEREFTLVMADYTIVVMGEALSQAIARAAPRARLHIRLVRESLSTEYAEGIRFIDGMVAPPTHGFALPDTRSVELFSARTARHPSAHRGAGGELPGRPALRGQHGPGRAHAGTPRRPPRRPDGPAGPRVPRPPRAHRRGPLVAPPV